jgi:hypothetical protein
LFEASILGTLDYRKIMTVVVVMVDSLCLMEPLPYVGHDALKFLHGNIE